MQLPQFSLGNDVSKVGLEVDLLFVCRGRHDVGGVAAQGFVIAG